MLAKIMLSFLFLSGSAPAASPEKDLAAFTGNFRTLAYNGVENHYSTKFFLPSVHLERSNKLKDREGNFEKSLAFAFEVPEAIGENEIYLKFLFTEAPLSSALISSGPGWAHISYEGEIQERLNGEWKACQANYEVALKTSGDKRLTIDFVKTAEAPCLGEEHHIEAERVVFDPPTFTPQRIW